MFDGSSHFVLYQSDVRGARLLLPPRLVPHRWVKYKEEKKLLGEMREKTKRNKRSGHISLHRWDFFAGKKYPVKKILESDFVSKSKMLFPSEREGI